MNPKNYLNNPFQHKTSIIDKMVFQDNYIAELPMTSFSCSDVN